VDSIAEHAPDTVTIFINRNRYVVAKGTYLGREILGIPLPNFDEEGTDLWLKQTGEASDIHVSPTMPLPLADGQEFFTSPALIIFGSGLSPTASEGGGDALQSHIA
jgi:hypothetical protein